MEPGNLVLCVNIPPVQPTLRLLNPTHTMKPIYFKIEVKFIIPSTTCLLPSALSPRIYKVSSHTHYLPRPLINPNPIVLITIDEEVKLWKSSIGITLSLTSTITFLGLNTILCTLNIFAALKATENFSLHGTELIKLEAFYTCFNIYALRLWQQAVLIFCVKCSYSFSTVVLPCLIFLYSKFLIDVLLFVN